MKKSGNFGIETGLRAELRRMEILTHPSRGVPTSTRNKWHVESPRTRHFLYNHPARCRRLPPLLSIPFVFIRLARCSDPFYLCSACVKLYPFFLDESSTRPCILAIRGAVSIAHDARRQMLCKVKRLDKIVARVCKNFWNIERFLRVTFGRTFGQG